MKTRVKIFRELIDNLCKTTDIGGMYRSLFNLKSDEQLDKELEYTHSRYNEDAEKEWWFWEWHKSIRQCDYFDRCYQLVDKRTPEQIEEMKELDKQLSQIRERIVFRLPRHPNDEDCSEEEVKKHEDSYKTLAADPEYKAIQSKKRKLLEIRDTSESVSGVFDSLLWNLIHVDKKGEITRVFETTFALYDVEVRYSTANQEN